MLWEVTDLDTDVLSTEFLSHWIPNKHKNHWKLIDKTQWTNGNAISYKDINVKLQDIPHQPNLLRALVAAKQSNLVHSPITSYACVARGIPVKIKT